MSHRTTIVHPWEQVVRYWGNPGAECILLNHNDLDRDPRPRERTPERMAEITYGDFEKVDIRVGRIVAVDDFPAARRPAWKLRIDFGPLGVKSSSAQIRKYYEPQDLLGKQVLAVVNFPPRQIANFFSEVLTLGVILGEGDIVLVHPEREVPPGSRIA